MLRPTWFDRAKHAGQLLLLLAGLALVAHCARN